MTHHSLAMRMTRRAGLMAIAAAMTLAPLLPGTSAEAATVASSSPELRDAANVALGELGVYTETGTPAAYRNYLTARSNVARSTARELGLDETAMSEAWGRADLPKQHAALAALSQLGVPYRTNTSDPGRGFDCSGLTTFAWGQAGLVLERQSGTQINASTALDRSQAELGDLVYYPGHVMMYLGVDNAIVHSPYTGRDVEVTFVTDRHVDRLRFGDPLN